MGREEARLQSALAEILEGRHLNLSDLCEFCPDFKKMLSLGFDGGGGGGGDLGLFFSRCFHDTRSVHWASPQRL